MIHDIAEKGITLIEDYNQLMTKNEHQLQFSLQVVEQHRQSFPGAEKKRCHQEGRNENNNQ